MTIPFIIGAYASHPALELQEDYYKLLAQQPWISGLEMPYPGQIATDNELLAGLLAANWDFNTVTAIPGTMQNVGKDANFGLASPDRDGREAALAFTRQLREDLGKLCEHADRNVVTRIEVHSAPTRTADGDAFRRSLEVLREWDWYGARLVIEHCDRFIPEQKPEKGFLSIEEEIQIAAEFEVGVLINWGRSVLEERSADAAYDHIVAAGKRGVLDGVVFSGAGPEETQYGYSWVDGHLPGQSDEPASLMSDAEIKRCAQAAIEGGCNYLGAKMCVPKDASLEERLAMLTHVYKACDLQ